MTFGEWSKQKAKENSTNIKRTISLAIGACTGILCEKVFGEGVDMFFPKSRAMRTIGNIGAFGLSSAMGFITSELLYNLIRNEEDGELFAAGE